MQISHGLSNDFLKVFIRLRAENHPAVGAGLDECRKVHYGEMSPQHVGGGPRRPLALPRGRREAAAGFSGTTAVKTWGSIRKYLKNYSAQVAMEYFVLLIAISAVAIVFFGSFSKSFSGSCESFFLEAVKRIIK